MSMLKTGLLQLSPDGVVVGDVSYYDRGPAVVDCIDRDSIAEALGPTSKVDVVHLGLCVTLELFVPLMCFDAFGWATGMASDP